MSSEKVRKRGGTFTRKQLEVIREYLATAKLPSVEKICSANLSLPISSHGVYGRLKSAARRLYLINGTLTHVTGKVVISVEEFIAEITKAHEGDTSGLHRNFQQTLEKLSETYTIGRRRFGMNKRLVEAVVKTCNSGRCRRKKKSSKQKEYEETIKAFHKKCSAKLASENVPTVTDKSDVTSTKKSQTNQTAKKRKRYSWVKGKSMSSSLVSESMKPIGSDGVKSKEKQLIQLKQNLLQEKSTPTSKSETITIGPFPVSVVKNASEPSQYQLGLLVPIVNQQKGESLPSTSKMVNTNAVCIPIMNTSTTSVTGGLPKNTTHIVTGNDLKMLPFTTLLQNMAKNCQTTQLSSSTANLASVPKQNTLLSSTFVPDPNRTNIENMMPNAKCHLPAENTQNKTGITVREMINQSLQKQPNHATSGSASNCEPPKKKKKVVKGENLDYTDSAVQSVKEIGGSCLIDGEKKDDDIVFADDDGQDENNNFNEVHYIDESTKIEDDCSDENNNAFEYAEKCGMYKNCLKTLCGLQIEEFELVMDRMHSNIYSEGPKPFTVSFHMMLDPPYPHIWYFYHEIKKERNIFKRIMVVIKDIQIDMNRAMMQELLAVDRLKRKMTYLESLIKKNKTYLDMCTTKSQKKMKKRKKDNRVPVAVTDAEISQKTTEYQ